MDDGLRQSLAARLLFANQLQRRATNADHTLSRHADERVKAQGLFVPLDGQQDARRGHQVALGEDHIEAENG